MSIGYFNLHIHNDSSAIVYFNNSLCSLGLVQHVDLPTHTKGQSLDLVIIEAANGVNIFSWQSGPFISDHCAVKVVTTVKKENIVSKSVVFQNFKEMNYTNFAKDLAELSIASNCVDQYVDQFEDEIKRLLDKHAPLTEKTKSIDHQNPGSVKIFIT